jgi:hypothetical protein
MAAVCRVAYLWMNQVLGTTGDGVAAGTLIGRRASGYEAGSCGDERPVPRELRPGIGLRQENEHDRHCPRHVDLRPAAREDQLRPE